MAFRLVLLIDYISLLVRPRKGMNRVSYIQENARNTPIMGSYDLIVCGAGPAGVCAAIAAARQGLSTLLIEGQGCLGGIWTSGLQCIVLDIAGKAGLLAEIQARLQQMEAILVPHTSKVRARFMYDPESMKVLLDEMCVAAGVEVRLHSRMVDVVRNGDTIEAVITESFSGREAFTARLFIDSTGNGDLAAYAGCTFEHGEESTGKVQPASLSAIVAGVADSQPLLTDEASKDALRALLRSVGVDPTYQKPFLFKLPVADLWCLMINHEYEVHCDSTEEITRATMRSRQEVYRAIQALRTSPGWENLHLVTTCAHIGLREGRRIKGQYRVTAHDLITGRRFSDGICLARYQVDIHNVKMEDGVAYTDGGHKVQPYHIPFRALLSKEVRNLGMAGRCISGDFYAHASYRVVGNAVATGEAIGIGAALSLGDSFDASKGVTVRQEMEKLGYEL